MSRCAPGAAILLTLCVLWPPVSAVFAQTADPRATLTRAGVDACHDAEGLTAIAGCSDAIADAALGDWDRAALLELRATHHRRRHDFAAALTDYDRAIALAPGKPSLYTARGETLGEMGGPTDREALIRARADFDTALSIRPGDPQALARRAHTTALLGDLDRAIADYEAALAAPTVATVLGGPDFMHATQENFAFALNARAWEQLMRGERAPALDDADRASRLLSDEPAIADTRAHALAASGRAEEAVEAHRFALMLGGAPWAARYRSALAAKGYPAASGEDGLIAALAACAAANCQPLAGER